MSSPAKAKAGGSLQPPANKGAPSIYDLDKEAQEQFARHARWLFGEYLRTGNEKHLRAFRVHSEAAQYYWPKLNRLARGQSLAALTYELRLLWHIAEGSSERKGKARQPGKKKGGGQ
jgi:hypothetical protein